MQTTTPSPARPETVRRSGYAPAPLRRSRYRSASAQLAFGYAPMLFAACWLAVGILVARWAWRPPLLLLMEALAALLLTGIAARHGSRVALFPLALVWLIAGQFSAEVMPRPAAARSFLRMSDGLQRRVTGTVLAIHSPRIEQRQLTSGAIEEETSQKIVIGVTGIENFTADRDWMQATHGGLQITLYARDGVSLPQVHCGEGVTATVHMHRGTLQRPWGVGLSRVPGPAGDFRAEQPARRSAGAHREPLPADAGLPGDLCAAVVGGAYASGCGRRIRHSVAAALGALQRRRCGHGERDALRGSRGTAALCAQCV